MPRELAGLDPISGPDARRQREAALLAVAAVEAAAEAEAAKPSMTKAQSLLAAYYGLTGRTPPAGVSLPDMSVAAPAMERAKKAKDAHNTAVFGASYKPSFNAGGVENFSGEFRPVCLGPFGGVDRTGDFARVPRAAAPRGVRGGRSSRRRATTSAGGTSWRRRRRSEAREGVTAFTDGKGVIITQTTKLLTDVLTLDTVDTTRESVPWSSS